jgi:molybdopterin-containing oxidoreductase family iron-sulfur binding subunit
VESATINPVNSQALLNPIAGYNHMSDKKYWKSLEDLNDSPEFIKQAQHEFAEPIPMDEFLSGEGVTQAGTPRRDFLKFLGFSVTAAALAACETKVRKVVPYVIKPEEITVGVSNWYASTFFDGHDYCDVVVKTREGRPIKIEGNRFSQVSLGGTNARVQASVLSLYDDARYASPQKAGQPATWEVVDKEISGKLASISASGGAVRILASSVISPSTEQLFSEFAAKYPNTRVVYYDALSASGIIESHNAQFGKAAVPTYHFDKADVIVGVDCDFLGAWVSPVEHAAQYGKGRKLNEEKTSMSRHYQFESLMTITGASADYRTGIKPSESGAVVAALYNAIASKTGGSTVSAKATSADKQIEAAASALVAAKGRSLLVCGTNSREIQQLVNAANSLLENYGKTVDLQIHSNTRRGKDAEVLELVNELKAGKVAALFVYNCNPAYSMPGSLGFGDAVKKALLSVSFADRPDETSSLCQYVCPDHHYLESWGDANPRPGCYSLIQPTIYPMFDTRSMQGSLMAWMGQSGTYQEYVKSYWEKNLFKLQSSESMFENWWMTSLHDGVRCFETAQGSPSFSAGDLSAAAAGALAALPGSGSFEVTFYESVALGNGSMANNPWLQELPDGISKVVWDNYIAMSPKQMKELGFETTREQEVKSDVAELSIGGMSVKLPVYPQPGQPYGTVSVALGYGRSIGGKVIENKEVLGGANMFALTSATGNIRFSAKAEIKKTGDTYMLASTQTHHTLMGRHMVKEATLAEWQKDKKAGNETETFKVKQNGKHVQKTVEELDLWATKKFPDFDRPGHWWNLSIDLNSCIGCGNCIVSCQAENNVPVVGKDEVRKSREMHWIRIDRYYSSDTTKENVKEGTGAIDMYHQMEVPSENPEVMFQPVMCMHCNHAPCETVCPVLATTHSTEGLNQMTYNRCVGTKYCANNCPYKVRRFNWFRLNSNPQFDFNQNSDLGKMVLNPDVTVRSRGVMEKCSMCVQRIQEGKLVAKRDGRRLNDGEINTACAQSCPTQAITFGDANDPNSQVSKIKKDERSYLMLEELDTKPSVFYQTKIRNKEAGKHKAEA